MKQANKIISIIKPGEWVCFGDVQKRIKWAESMQDRYYRAWQELKINGQLQIGVSGLYRVSQ